MSLDEQKNPFQQEEVNNVDNLLPQEEVASGQSSEEVVEKKNDAPAEDNSSEEQAPAQAAPPGEVNPEFNCSNCNGDGINLETNVICGICHGTGKV